jgi:hypothetical protein
MRIDYSEAVAIVKVCENHVAHERSFANSGLSKDHHMLASNIARD